MTNVNHSRPLGPCQQGGRFAQRRFERSPFKYPKFETADWMYKNENHKAVVPAQRLRTIETVPVGNGVGIKRGSPRSLAPQTWLARGAAAATACCGFGAVNRCRCWENTRRAKSNHCGSVYTPARVGGSPVEGERARPDTFRKYLQQKTRRAVSLRRFPRIRTSSL